MERNFKCHISGRDMKIQSQSTTLWFGITGNTQAGYCAISHDDARALRDALCQEYGLPSTAAVEEEDLTNATSVVDTDGDTWFVVASDLWRIGKDRAEAEQAYADDPSVGQTLADISYFHAPIRDNSHNDHFRNVFIDGDGHTWFQVAPNGYRLAYSREEAEAEDRYARDSHTHALESIRDGLQGQLYTLNDNA